MATQRDGGPAGANYPEQNGMSLRDRVAIAALQALIAEPPWGDGCRSVTDRIADDVSSLEEAFAAASFRLADAWLKARKA